MNKGKKEKIYDIKKEPLLNEVHSKRTVDCINHGKISCYSMQSLGNIFSYSKNEKTKWSQTGKVNDVDTVARKLSLISSRRRKYFCRLARSPDKHNT